MKQKILNLTLLLFCMIVGIGSAWGEEYSETITFTNKDWAPWTNIKSGSSFESASLSRGVANNAVNGSCTSTADYTKVTKVEVVCSSNTTGGKVAILINGQQIGNKDVANSNNQTLVFDSNDNQKISTYSGKIQLNVTKPTSKTVWVKSVTIYYGDEGDSGETGGGDDSPGASTDENDYTIDFENEAKTYTNWEIHNFTSAQTDANVSAHGGSCFGTISSASGYIQTNNKIASPLSISFFVSKATSNDTSSTWKVQVSSNGTSWVDVKSQDATNMARGAWVEVTADLSTKKDVYVRIYYTGSTAKRCIDDVVLTCGIEGGGNDSDSKKNVTLFKNTNITVAPNAEGNITEFVVVPEEYDGIIYYGSDDDEVIYIDQESGDYLSGNSGTTTIFATAEATNKYNQIYETVTVTISIPVTLSSVELSGNPTKTSYKVGENFDTAGLTVTAKYSDNSTKDVTSSTTWEIDPKVLSVDTEVVTVSATYEGKEDIQEYSVTVVAQEETTPSTGVYYQKITSQSDIKAGETYLIVCESENTAMGSQNTNRRNNASVTIENGIIKSEKVNAERYPYEVTLTDEAGLFAMVLSNGKYLGNGAEKSNNLKEVNSISGGYCWSLTYSGGSVTMRTNHADNPRYLCVNTTNADSYATYTEIGSYKKVTLYKKVAPTTAIITLNAACTDGNLVYGTYSNSSAFVVPKELKVSEISIKDNNTLDVKSYNTGKVVPANTGVMVSALKDGDYTVTLSNEVGTSVLGDSNYLHPSSEPMTGDNLFYRLTMHNGTQIGYWWGAENGAAFNLGANKAYLAVPKEKSVKANLWFGGAETSISAPAALNADNGVIYNLNGQRVSSATKGIYIKNGKKYFIK